MRIFLIGLLTILANSSMAAPEILLGNLPGKTFSAVINEQDPTKLTIQNIPLKSNSTYNFHNTISDIRKLTLKVSDKNSQEMLLVVLAVANTEQTVKIFIPVPNQNIPLRTQKLNPVCEFKNQGSFLGEDDGELQGKFLIQNNNLMVKVGIYDGVNPVVYHLEKCLSF